MNNIELTCVQCTESVNGGFVIKLQNKSDVVVTSIFGTTIQKSQVTYYQKIAAGIKLVNDVPMLENGNSLTPIIGFKGTIDLSVYQITEMPYTIPETGLNGQPNANAGEVVMNKWLFLRKPAVAA